MGKSAAGGIPILGGLGNSIGALPLPALAAATAVGILAVAGKSIVDISDKWESAQRGLAQATDAVGVSNDKARQFVDHFIDSNKKFVSNQAEVVDSYAALTREGLSQKQVQEDLGLALDLSAIKQISLTDATTLLQQAEMGRGKGLVALGINMKDYPVLAEAQTQANKKVESATRAADAAQAAYTAAVKAHGPHSAQAHAAAVKLRDATAKLADAHNYAADRAKASADIHATLHQKLDDGRKKTSDLQKATNDLGNSWQDFAHKTGPVLVKALTLALTAVDDLFNGLGNLITRMSEIAHFAPGANSFAVTNAAAFGPQAVANVARQRNYRAAGGPVNPYGDYVVGESGPELLHMGSQGGIIIPHGKIGGGGMVIHNHFEGAFILDGPTVDRLANLLAQRLSYATGR